MRTITKFTGLLSAVLCSAVLVFASGCGGDDDGGGSEDVLGEIGFATPMGVTTAYTEVEGLWVDQGPANWSCLGTPSTDSATEVEVALTGFVEDFQTGEAIPGASITLYGDEGITSSALATSESDLDGRYAITLPIGETHWAFKIEIDSALDSFTLNQTFDPVGASQEKDLDSVSLLTAQALPAFIGVTRTPGLGIVAGAVRDCDGNEVLGAVAAISDTADVASHLDGGVSYYFSALSTSLPVRHSQQSMTNTDGVFVSIELPPSSESYVQMWGFVDEADMEDGEMTLLSQVSAPILADAVVTASMNPLRE